MTQAARLPRVVVLGGGFGGLYAARALSELPVKLTVVDRRNHHVFQPLLYQVATAALTPSEIATPIRHLVRGENVEVVLEEAVGIDVAARAVGLADGTALPYDFLVVATGATHSYFGHPEWERYAPGLKTLEDALEIRRRVLLAFERAEREADPGRRDALMTFVIIGAGPTGVELAGALGEISRKAMTRDFVHIDPRKARIVLVEGLSRVLPPYPERLSQKAAAALRRLGVELRTGEKVTAIDEEGVSLGAERIRATTVLWAAGVQASPVAASLGAPLDRAGRVMVTPQLAVPGHDEVFVIGDLAHLEQDGQPVPGIAPAAMQEGRYAATAIERRLLGEQAPPFRYFDRGTFAVIGRGAAVGLLFGRYRFSGFFAWVLWLFIHIMYLVGFRNRIVVMVEWAYSFLTLGRSSRLITYDLPAAPHRLPAPHPPRDRQDGAATRPS